MKIKIYARDIYEAARFAATMNLSLRHWEYAGPHELGVWADVGTVMEDYNDVRYDLGLPL